MKERMKPLSFREAERCENAREPQCKCRCGGAAHGAKRGTSGQLEMRGFYEALEDTDPHHIPSEKERKELARIRANRASLRKYRVRYPSAWSVQDETDLAQAEREIERLERIVLGIQHKAELHA